MKKLVEISEGRAAVINSIRVFEREAINEQSKRFKEEELEHFTLNDKPDLMSVRIHSIEILSPSYENKSTILTFMDWMKINDGAEQLFEEVRNQTYTLNDYYS